MSFSITFATLFGLFYICDSFNLETRLPVIKRGNEGSYFGFSVAEHQSVSEVEGLIEHNWILVGAPLDQNKQPQTNNSGALWRCPISTNLRDCDQVTTDGKRRIDDIHLEPPQNDEVKDGQWLGVTVRSEGTGKKVLVCAHRYIRSGIDYRFGGGLCYTLSQRLDVNEPWEPCKGKPNSKGHEQYGFCQAGTSGIIVNDDAVFGSPGPYTWRGQIYVVNVSEDYLDRDKTPYYSPVESNPPVDKYSYLGMSVAAAEFFGNGLAYAAGAPRSRGTGEVLIFTKSRPNENAMKINTTLIGEQFTSNFGYEIAVADINGDKIPDILVGAPNYFTKDTGGAVYIYLNNKKYCLQCQERVKLTGQPESRFGISIANLGDLNKDGFDDVAIGAPYEGRGTVYIYLGSKDGIIKQPSQVIRGEEFGLRTFGYSLSGGLDLDNNGYPDLLAGAFESDAVVLLRARPIVGLSTRVGPASHLSNIDPNGKGCESHPNSTDTCFRFEACVSMQEVVQTLIPRNSGNIRLKYKLETDIHKKIPRVWTGHSNTKPNTIEHEIGLQLDTISGELKHCQYHTVFIKEGTKDIQSAIAMRLTYWLVQAEPKKPREGDRLPSVNDFPILNQQQAAKVFEATFLKDCGDNDICESELYVKASLDLPAVGENSWELVLGEHQEVLLNASLFNLKESAYEAQLNIHHSPSLSYIGHVRQKDKTHICQPANNSLVVCNVGNPLERNQMANVLLRFDPRGLTDIESKVEFIISPNTTSSLHEPMFPYRLVASVIKRAELSLKGLARPEQVFYGGEIKGESAMVYKDDIGSRILHTYQVVNQGPWHVSTLELHIDWPFQVANNKPLGKWLLYMDEKPSVEALGGGECTMSPGQVNYLGLLDRPGFLDSPFDPKPTPGPANSTVRAEALSRRRRDIEKVVRSEPWIDRDGRRHDIVNMNCEEGTAKCFRFKCVIYKLQKNQEATVFIKARLWNTTLVEDYPQAYLVKIASRAKIHITPSIIIHQDTSDDIAQVETVARMESFKPQTVEDVPLWIILLACISGILVLLLLVVVLWKLGFFKRRRPDPTLSGNLEKHRVDDYHDY